MMNLMMFSLTKVVSLIPSYYYEDFFSDDENFPAFECRSVHRSQTVVRSPATDARRVLRPTPRCLARTAPLLVLLLLGHRLLRFHLPPVNCVCV